MKSRQVRLIFGGVFFALLSVYCAASFYIWLYPTGSDGGWHGSGSYGEFYITRIDPQSPAKDLRPGEEIIAINGVKVAEHADALGDEYRLPPGSRYVMTVERDGRELTFSWQTIARLLSDGLPERFNASGEMFGYDRSKESLLANAQAAPQAVIDRLLQTGEDWAAGKAADDDMTFVALKMK